MTPWIDVVLVLLVTVAWPLFEHRVALPRLRSALARGEASALAGEYHRTVVVQWSLVALVVAWAVASGRPGHALGGVPGDALRLVATFAIAVVGAALLFAQTRVALRATPEALAPTRAALASLEWFLPRTRAQWRAFVPLAVTAGICEEILFRGFVLAVLAGVLPLPLALAGQAVLFGAAHAYQGTAGAVRAGLTGAVLGGVVWLTGSLVAAIVLHAALDLSAGRIAYALLAAEADGAGDPAGRTAAA